MENFESSRDLVLSQLNDLKTKGYDSVHLPGGTSKDGSFYSGVVVPVYNKEQKKFYFVGVPYDSHFHVGKENGHNKKLGENPEQTVIRELLEETGLQVKLQDLNQICIKKIPNNRPGRNSEFHFKYFYLAMKFTGNLFTFEGPNPIDGETAAPILIPANIFIEVIFKGHLDAVKIAFDKLMEDNRDYAYALMNIA